MRPTEKTAECAFNYSDDESEWARRRRFRRLPITLQQGDKLKHDLRFDHLGLDAELDSLLAAEKERKRDRDCRTLRRFCRSIVGR